MKRRQTSWRLGALAAIVALVVVALGAGAGQSALGGSSQSGVLDQRDHRLDHEHRPRRATTTSARSRSARTSSRSSTSRGTAPRSSRRSRPVALLGGTARVVAVQPPTGRQVPRRLRLRLGGREVLVRPGHRSSDRDAGGCEHPLVAPLESDGACRRTVDTRSRSTSRRRSRPGRSSSRRAQAASFRARVSSATGSRPTISRRSERALPADAGTRRASRPSSSGSTTTGARRRGTRASSFATTRSRRR